MVHKDEHLSSAIVEDPSVVTQVEPEHSPAPEGTVLPKIPFTAMLITGVVIFTGLIVLTVARSYYNIAP
jgi:hypothetical protein